MHNHRKQKHLFRCENIILGCTHDVSSYNSVQCCHKIFGNRIYVTDLATMCVSTAKQQPLEEIFASQVYGLTVYLKTNTHDRFGKNVLLPRERAKKKHGKFILRPIFVTFYLSCTM